MNTEACVTMHSEGGRKTVQKTQEQSTTEDYLFIASVRANRAGNLVSFEGRTAYTCRPDDSDSESTGVSKVGEKGTLDDIR